MESIGSNLSRDLIQKLEVTERPGKNPCNRYINRCVSAPLRICLYTTPPYIPKTREERKKEIKSVLNYTLF